MGPQEKLAAAQAALTAIEATCRGSGPMARDRDADTLRMIGLYAEAVLKTLADPQPSRATKA